MRRINYHIMESMLDAVVPHGVVIVTVTEGIPSLWEKYAAMSGLRTLQPGCSIVAS